MPPDQFELKVKTANDNALLSMLDECSHGSPYWHIVFSKIQLRGIKNSSKVHWSLHLATVAAVIAAITGIAAVYLQWPQ